MRSLGTVPDPGNKGQHKQPSPTPQFGPHPKSLQSPLELIMRLEPEEEEELFQSVEVHGNQKYFLF